MPNFSLVHVQKLEPIDSWMTPGRIKGLWVQNHVGGTIETATAAAIRTEEANGNRLDIAVVPSIITILNYDTIYNLERLDEQRIKEN
jgi:hypothetical protein